MAKKKNQVKKVSKETGVEEKQLERLPKEALQKLDDLVPDEDLIGSDEPEVEEIEVDVDELNAQAEELNEVEGEFPEDESEHEVENEEEDESEVEEEKKELRFVGRHPITKEAIYK